MGPNGEKDTNGRESPREPPDGALARKVQEGDRRAFELLVRRYIHPVHAVAASFLRERADVEDAAQETFLRALDAIARFDPRRPFAPWLYQIARNVARNRVKFARRHPTESISAPETSLADAAPDPAVAVERGEVRALVAQAIDRLPERRRTVVQLVDVEGYSTKEVAELMGLTQGAVRAHLHHARAALRAHLAPILRNGEDRDDPQA